MLKTRLIDYEWVMKYQMNTKNINQKTDGRTCELPHYPWSHSFSKAWKQVYPCKTTRETCIESFIASNAHNSIGCLVQLSRLRTQGWAFPPGSFSYWDIFKNDKDIVIVRRINISPENRRRLRTPSKLYFVMSSGCFAGRQHGLPSTIVYISTYQYKALTLSLSLVPKFSPMRFRCY